MGQRYNRRVAGRESEGLEVKREATTKKRSRRLAKVQEEPMATLLPINATIENHTTPAQLPLQFFLNDKKMFPTNMSSPVGPVKACTLKSALEMGT